MTGPLNAQRTISGTFGKTIDENGNWLNNVYKIEANIEITFADVKRSGTRWMGNKVTGLKGSGTIGSYMITSEWIEKMAQVTDDKSSPFTTQLIVTLADPESFGAYRVRLMNVTFDKIPVVQYEVGEIVDQELTFLFSGYEVLESLRGEG
ncbi:phage tail tube protein [Paenibacillus wulumuqiensis]|uniref:phage tail tube protein n=1 Tax=Paenibacillus wulumuqiensis TaxID=1567107 RepID=UPI00061990EE|nr:phage tail tube protein [Paenibacillus wulumuqiensis]